MKFEVGDLVRIVGEMREGEGPGWTISMRQCINTVSKVKEITSTGYYVMENNSWAWMDKCLEPVMVLDTKKVMRGNVKCRQIVGFRGFPKYDDLNPVYKRNRVWFGMRTLDRSDNGKHEVSELGVPTWKCAGHSDGGPQELLFEYPTGELPRIDVGMYTLSLIQNSVFTEETFQNIVAWLKRAKHAYIELYDAEDWSGVEEVVI